MKIETTIEKTYLNSIEDFVNEWNDYALDKGFDLAFLKTSNERVPDKCDPINPPYSILVDIELELVFPKKGVELLGKTSSPKKCSKCYDNDVGTWILKGSDHNNFYLCNRCLVNTFGCRFKELAEKKIFLSKNLNDHNFSRVLEDDYAYYDPKQYISSVAYQIDNEGWVAKSSSSDKTPTFQKAQNPISFNSDKEEKRYKNFSETVLEWASNINPSSLSNDEDGFNYLLRIKNIAQKSHFHSNDLPLAASIVDRYNKSHHTSEWVGEIGERDNFVFEVRHSFKCMNGARCYKMKDENDNYAVWFTKSENTRLETGRTYKIEATVGGHRTYKGRKETRLKRCFCDLIRP